jgi:hypothetical protein
MNSIPPIGFAMPIAATQSHPRRVQQLELELDEARRVGRWLSDEEWAERALAEERQLEDLAQQRQRRRKLVALLVVSLLIPPLWPLAAALTLYLLFPASTVRLAVATGLSLLVLGGLAALLLTTLVVALLMAVF